MELAISQEKYLIEDMMMEMAKSNDDFSIKYFFDGLNGMGNIPVSLGKV